MKKYFLTLVAAMAFTFSFAETSSNRVENLAHFDRIAADRAASRFDMNCDMRRLSALLDLNEWQMEAVGVIQSQFNDEILSLSSMRGPRLHQKVRQAVRKDARQMHQVLNEKQFSTYMTLLTTTLRNKHL